MKANKLISVLLPTRGRTDVLKKSLQSLIDTAADATNIEIIFGIDQDDTVVADYMKTEIAPMLQAAGIEARANVFKPLGYENLHVYVNTLANSSSGEWLFFWNDDGVMLTENWDQIIDSYTGEFKLLAPRDNHNGHPYAIFPIVPRDWYILIGHLSQNAQNDAWLSHIAYMLNIFERIDVEFFHDRADLTGNNNDDTFKNRKYQEGNPTDPNDFGHPDMQNARVATAHKLAWFMEKTGRDVSWWNNVVAGKQNPFEKMVWGQGVLGAGQLPAVDDQADQFSDDQTIML
jgi:hypothetical protein